MVTDCSHYKSQKKSGFLWDANFIEDNKKLRAYVTSRGTETITFKNNLHVSYTCVWQQKVQKARKFIGRQVEPLSYQPVSAFTCRVLCKVGSDVTGAGSFRCKSWSPLSWFQPADSLNSINVMRAGQALANLREIFNGTIYMFFRAGGDHGI